MAGEFEEIQRRRTFTIISHPDARRTILTEKLLLYGDAINLAGSIKGRKTGKHTVSDWMDIEEERDISVTNSVLQFDYEGFYINILNTSGHEDFSEDTCRTLMAADSVVMVIDASGGMEAQTRKLFKVCTLRHTPIFTFINKMGRETRDPFALTDGIEELLDIRTCPANQPIGSDKNFKGVLDRNTRKITTFQAAHAGMQEIATKEIDFSDPAFRSVIGEDYLVQLTEKTELLDGTNDELDVARVSRDDLTPVFFGSALTNFGVETFLGHFLKMTTPPPPRETKSDEVNPMEDPFFSAFVFKIQANMNKVHRNRIAFMHICSGEYQASMEVTYAQGKRKIHLNQLTQMMADKRKIVEAAYAGDIIGVFDPGIPAIGNTLENARGSITFEGIPTFVPGCFARVRRIDTMKRKQFTKGIKQIAQEDTIQIFQERNTDMGEIVVDAVGVLQFEVLTYRLRAECSVEVRLGTLSYEYIHWTDEPETVDVDKIQDTSDMKLVQNLKGEPLLLFAHLWSVRMVEEQNPGPKLLKFGKSQKSKRKAKRRRRLV